ncbi:MAG: transposase, partial [Cytophagaceae bacterium]
WELLRKNGKEFPHATFNKKTAHLFRKDLLLNHPHLLDYFKVHETERSTRFWIRDPLAVLMDSKKKVEQKLDYIHLNPLQEKWNLAKSPEDYFWSSANFYETGKDDFGFLTHYMERF